METGRRVRVALALIVLLSWRALHGETLIMLDDCEGRSGAWPQARFVSEGAHAGQWALKWDVEAAPSINSPHYLSDWTAFDELRFWAHVESPADFNIPIVFVSDGGYYITDWRLDWRGWKEHRIRLTACRKAHSPEGWHKIRAFGFRAHGYGQGPPPKGISILFDDFALHSTKDLPEKQIGELVLKERRQEMEQLKARGNPYLLNALESLKDLKPEPALPEKLTSSWQFSGLANDAFVAAWGAGWEDSPRKGDETLIAHASALIDFCLAHQKDGSWFYSRKWESGDPNSDRFALGPLMDAAYWLRRTAQGQAAWKRWEGAFKELVEFQYTRWGRYKAMGFTKNEAWGSSAGAYPNQDVFHLMEMALAHEFWGDSKYLDSARETLDGLEAHLLPDGGFNYIGPETEIPCYHDLNVLWIARYFQFTKDERARSLLARTVNYYPLAYSNEGRPEYYTDCWWKHCWADGKAACPEIIAGITGDGRNKWLADRLNERLGIGKRRAYTDVYAGMFYRHDVKPTPLPDNYVMLDRNIGGPRGRFGRWYFAATAGGGARDTFVGAMISEPGQVQALNGAFLAANIEVAVGDKGQRHQTHLYVSGPDDISDAVIGPECAALGARYSPRKPYINSIRNPEIPRTAWEATQTWLLTRHGLVGLAELEATQEQEVFHLGGELRFGPAQPLSRDTGAGIFRCGAIAMQLLEHNFASVEFGPARPGYAQTATPHSAVVLKTAGQRHTARPGSPVRYAAFIAPQDAPAVQEYARIERGGIWGFTARLGGKKTAVLFNPGPQAVRAALPWPAGEATAYRARAAAERVRADGGSLHVTVHARSTALVVCGE